MKRILGAVLCLVLLGSLTGCGLSGEEAALLDAISGCWSSEDEKLFISGSSIEFTGYYEWEGRRLAGTAEMGKIVPGRDGTFTVEQNEFTREGVLREDGVLVIGTREYRR